MSNTPSLRELLDFADAFDWQGWAVPKNAQAAFARAVLAKWGTPQPAHECHHRPPCAECAARARLGEKT